MVSMTAPAFALPTAHEIVLGFCAASGFTYLQLIAHSKRRYWVKARRRIAEHLREADFSYFEIGEALKRDRTSVMSLLGALPGKRKRKLEVCK